MLRKETLVLDDIKEILGERPFEAKSNFKKYLELSEKDGKTQPPPEEKHVWFYCPYYQVEGDPVLADVNGLLCSR